MKQKNIYILAIESSCDDTSAAVLRNNEVLSNMVATQKIHEQYGGVVPELASRAHQQHIVPVVHQALVKANIDKKELSAIAFTRGPGLLGSLLVGTSFAKSLALGLNIPLIEVNHMQAHILAHFIAEGKKEEGKGGRQGKKEKKEEGKGGRRVKGKKGKGEDVGEGKDGGKQNDGSGQNDSSKRDGTRERKDKNEVLRSPAFPFLALTISGGHTQIVLVKNHFDMEILGETLDDAVGEAFDKSAKILGLPYPGGPLVDKYAQEGNPDAYPFPKPKVDGLNFSFSGLKTSILYFIQRETEKNPDFVKDNLKDICASIQKTIVAILMDKLKKAAKQTGITSIAIGGGVSANSGIRMALKQAEKRHGWKTYVPKFEYCTDNAAMIGIVGYLKYQAELFSDQGVTAKARFQIPNFIP